MLINLGFIKAVNGLFYFAMDYLAELHDAVSAVLVRSPELRAAVQERFPGTTIRVVTAGQAARQVWVASHRGEIVFTPSPHPIPWCDRQLVVVHDTFPFDGAKGAAKALLFSAAMRSCGAMAGYINVSDAKGFLLDRARLDSGRTMASPNHVVLPVGRRTTEPLRWPERPQLGLFGTDSSKKNYEQLFERLAEGARGAHLRIRLYGQSNDYIRGILGAYTGLDIVLQDSREIGLEPFLRSVDMVVSAATREGFSRPTALALSLGVPCWLVEAPVFREFYGSAATFHATLDTLADALSGLEADSAVMRPSFTSPVELEQSFRDCVAWLRRQDHPSR